MRRFTGRRALVTGGAGGIGAAIAGRLVAEGAEVIIADADASAVQRTASEFGATPLCLDVGDIAHATSVLADIGVVDVLVNNAGIDDFGRFTEMSADRWRHLLAVNVEGAFVCTRAVLPGMQRSGYGRIVMITSEAGRIGAKGNAVYAATKAALIGFAKALARENARYGVTVNAIAPGPVETPMLDANRRLPNGDRIVAAMIAGTQLRRLGSPGEVASAVAFLAAEEASYITGEVLGVSGGMGLGA
jgi:2-hydroxycyclohexanecarboxyl-CoA dehydrogenase